MKRYNIFTKFAEILLQNCLQIWDDRYVFEYIHFECVRLLGFHDFLRTI